MFSCGNRMGRVVVVLLTSLRGVVVRIISGNRSRMPRPPSSCGLGIGPGLPPPPDSMILFLISFIMMVSGLKVDDTAGVLLVVVRSVAGFMIILGCVMET